MEIVSLPGSGHFFVALIYVVLLIILTTCLFVLIVKKFKSRNLIIFSLALICYLGIFIFLQMRTVWGMELKHVGEYKLKEYPNCNDCKIELLENNTYKINSLGKLIEKGKWNLVTGDDYYVIELNNGKQFGYNEYRTEGKINK